MKDVVTLLFIPFCIFGAVHGLVEHDMTVVVPPGRRECFHQYIKENNNFDFEYQVIEGGDLDINFILRSPKNVPLATDARKEDAVHTFLTTEEGDYLFCFDNSFSRIAEKVVFFDYVIDSDSTDDDVVDEVKKATYFDAYAAQELYEMKIEDIQEALDGVRDNLRKSQTHQRNWRNVEFRDRYIAERNYERVGFWSILTSVVMVATFIVQVIMIRSLFSNTTKVVT